MSSTVISQSSDDRESTLLANGAPDASFSGFPEWSEAEVIADKFAGKSAFADNEFAGCMPPCIMSQVDEYKKPLDLLVQSGYAGVAPTMVLPLAQMSEYFYASQSLGGLFERDGTGQRTRRPATATTALDESGHPAFSELQTLSQSSELEQPIHPRSAPPTTLLDRQTATSCSPIASKLFAANQHLLCSETVRQILTYLHALFEQSKPSKLTAMGGTATAAQTSAAVSEDAMLYDLIYPKSKEGLPMVSPSGRYVVKLFWMGAFRMVQVDDRIPVDQLGRALVPTSPHLNELWIPILSKALIKLASLSYQEAPCPDTARGTVNTELDIDQRYKYHYELGKFDVTSALKGVYTETVGLTPLQLPLESYGCWLESKWDLLKSSMRKYSFLNSPVNSAVSASLANQSNSTFVAIQPQLNPQLQNLLQPTGAPVSKENLSGNKSTNRGSSLEKSIKANKEVANSGSLSGGANAGGQVGYANNAGNGVFTGSNATLSSNGSSSPATAAGGRSQIKTCLVFAESNSHSSAEFATPFPTLARLVDWREQMETSSVVQRYVKVRYSLFSCGVNRSRSGMLDQCAGGDVALLAGVTGNLPPQSQTPNQSLGQPQSLRRRSSLTPSSAGIASHAAQSFESGPGASQILKKNSTSSIATASQSSQAQISGNTPNSGSMAGESVNQLFSAYSTAPGSVAPPPKAASAVPGEAKDIIESWYTLEEFLCHFMSLRIHHEPTNWKQLHKWQQMTDSGKVSETSAESSQPFIYLKDCAKPSTVYVAMSTYQVTAKHPTYDVTVSSSPAKLCISSYNWREVESEVFLKQSTNCLTTASFTIPAHNECAFRVSAEAANGAVIQIFSRDGNVTLDDEAKYLTDYCRLQLKDVEGALPTQIASLQKKLEVSGHQELAAGSDSSVKTMPLSHILFKAQVYFRTDTLFRATAVFAEQLNWYPIVHVLPTPDLEAGSLKCQVSSAAGNSDGSSSGVQTAKSVATIKPLTLLPITPPNSVASFYPANPNLPYVIIVEAVRRVNRSGPSELSNVEASKANTNISAAPVANATAAANVSPSVTPSPSSVVGNRPASGSLASHLKLTSTNKWRLRLVANACLPDFAIERGLEFGVKPNVTELDGTFVPTFRQRLIFRQTVKIKEANYTSLSAQLSLNIPDMTIVLQLLDNNVEIARAKGRGSTGFLLAHMRRDEEPDSASSANPATLSGANGAAGNIALKASKPSSKVTLPSSAAGAVQSASSVDAAAISAPRHKYVIQAIICEPDLSKWTPNSRAGSNLFSNLKTGVNAVTGADGATIAGVDSVAANSTSSGAKKNSTSPPRRQTVSNVSGAGSGLKANGSAAAATGNSSDDILSSSLATSGPIVFYNLRLVSLGNAVISLSKDTEREDRLKQVKEAWEVKQPGRSARARELREAFLKQIAAGQVKPPYVSGYPLGSIVPIDQVSQRAGAFKAAVESSKAASTAKEEPTDDCLAGESANAVSMFYPWDTLVKKDLHGGQLCVDSNNFYTQGYVEM